MVMVMIFNTDHGHGHDIRYWSWSWSWYSTLIMGHGHDIQHWSWSWSWYSTLIMGHGHGHDIHHRSWSWSWLFKLQDLGRQQSCISEKSFPKFSFKIPHKTLGLKACISPLFIFFLHENCPFTLLIHMLRVFSFSRILTPRCHYHHRIKNF